jgi:hypothetical protein
MHHSGKVSRTFFLALSKNSKDADKDTMILVVLLLLMLSCPLGANSELQKTAKMAESAMQEFNEITGSWSAPCFKHGGQYVGLSGSSVKVVRTYGGDSVQIGILDFAKPYPTFDSSDDAAIFFANLIRDKFPDQKVEYCTFILKESDKYTIKEVIRGTPGSCPRPNDMDISQIAAAVHTHPGVAGEGASNFLGSSIQLPSMSDYAVAKYYNIPQYMGAPAGHVLKYTNKSIKCKGSSFIKREYQILQDPSPNSTGKLQTEDVWTPIKRGTSDYRIMKQFICK